MKKLLAAISAVTLMLGIGAAFAAAADHQPQDHGLCTAYFNGQKKGWTKNGTPGPFTDLENRAGADQTASEVDQAASVYDYCQAVVIGGNPDHGRYTCVAGNTADQDPTNDSTTCSNNPPPGNSGHTK